MPRSIEIRVRTVRIATSGFRPGRAIDFEFVVRGAGIVGPFGGVRAVLAGSVEVIAPGRCAPLDGFAHGDDGIVFMATCSEARPEGSQDHDTSQADPCQPW